MGKQAQRAVVARGKVAVRGLDAAEQSEQQAKDQDEKAAGLEAERQGKGCLLMRANTQYQYRTRFDRATRFAPKRFPGMAKCQRE